VSLLVVALKRPLPPGSKKAAASKRKRKSRAKASPEKKMKEKEKRKESMQRLRSNESPDKRKARLAVEREHSAFCFLSAKKKKIDSVFSCCC